MRHHDSQHDTDAATSHPDDETDHAELPLSALASLSGRIDCSLGGKSPLEDTRKAKSVQIRKRDRECEIHRPHPEPVREQVSREGESGSGEHHAADRRGLESSKLPPLLLVEDRALERAKSEDHAGHTGESTGTRAFDQQQKYGGHGAAAAGF